MWLQNKRDVALERSRPPSHRREDQHEFRVGRLKHERVKVPRGDEVSVFFFFNLLAWFGAYVCVEILLTVGVICILFDIVPTIPANAFITGTSLATSTPPPPPSLQNY